MKRILGIMGSPRLNGNTHIMVSRILEGAKEAGAKTEMLLLKDLLIKECNGCLKCWKGKECRRKDDMNEIYPKIIESDVIIFGTPVYWFGPTALMKSFIDRFVYFNCPENRKKIKGKSVITVIPFEDSNPKTAYGITRFFKECFDYLELKLTGRIIAPGLSKKGEVLKKKEYLLKCRQLGREIGK